MVRLERCRPVKMVWEFNRLASHMATGILPFAGIPGRPGQTGLYGLPSGPFNFEPARHGRGRRVAPHSSGGWQRAEKNRYGSIGPKR
jgi:hypothetical protein